MRARARALVMPLPPGFTLARLAGLVKSPNVVSSVHAASAIADVDGWEALGRPHRGDTTSIRGRGDGEVEVGAERLDQLTTDELDERHAGHPLDQLAEDVAERVEW